MDPLRNQKGTNVTQLEIDSSTQLSSYLGVIKGTFHMLLKSIKKQKKLVTKPEPKEHEDECAL